MPRRDANIPIRDTARPSSRELQDLEDVYVIPKSCHETFLFSGIASYDRSLREAGLVGGGSSHVRTPYEMRRRGHESHILIYTVSGSGHLVTRDVDQSVGAGMLFALPASTPHAYWATGRWEIMWFLLATEKRWRHLIKAGVLVRESECIVPLRSAMSAYFDERRLHRRDSDGILGGHVSVMAGHIERELSFALSPADREQRLSLERLWADASADDLREWSVASLARRSGYSEKHFGRLVRKHCGVSPREMILRIRMHRAMEMLRATDVTLDAIASRLGYDTGFSFSRAFKQYAGKSPKAFRADCV